MKDKKYYINLTEQERSQIIHSLIDKKNALMAQGRYTDAVDEVILKLMKAKKLDYWYLNESPYPNLGSTDVFAAGKEYALRVIFTANEGSL